ncbi:hypothetical protein Micbo1qcDRAFT_219949 [Microdochium bolleyi]|uniref:ubiquitinyl hydrolase 1 n=1 Tax=Microdochium bolleyi TaxID=196109 RepID=A0A136IMK7_9PEZI|nr:hypothetical protein Micbo1qcDRAFT_219949 [Microdochium bolleyi]
MAVEIDDMTREVAVYAINHLFLPPKLPEQDDYSQREVQALCDFVVSVLQNFLVHTSTQHKTTVQAGIDLLDSFMDVHTVGKEVVSIQPDRLVGKLRQLCTEGGSVLLQVSKQNAAILINRKTNELHFEVLELTPSNESILATKGRLVRDFPGQAFSVPVASLQGYDIIESLANSISKMSFQESTLSQPVANKNGADHIEIRESTNPIIVTDFLSALLLTLGEPVSVATIRKNMREEVMYESCLVPWTRSPTWLVFRVALHLTMARLENDMSSATEVALAPIYKQFVVYLMARLSHVALRHDLASDVLHVMTSKLSRRLHKLGSAAPAWVLSYVGDVVAKTNVVLKQRWALICEKDPRTPGFPLLQDLDFHQDTFASIPNLDNFIAGLANPQLQQPEVMFAPGHTLSHLATGKLPSVTASKDKYTSFHLAAIETWVEHSLDSWIKREASSPKACAASFQLLQDYHKAATKLYCNNPEGTSLMILTCMELWIGCNKSAQRICPLLAKFHDATIQPSLVLALLQSLILPRKSQMVRLHVIEEYLQICSKNSHSESPSIFSSYGQAKSFFVSYYNQSPDQQVLKALIEADATAERQRRQAELREKQERYRNLVTESETLNHDYYTSYTREGYPRQEHNEWCCRRCELRRLYMAMEITVHEWPLPKAQQKAKNVVFELRPPTWFTPWRDATAYLLMSVLSLAYGMEESANERHHLSTYPQLKQYASIPTGQRITLLSTVKSFLLAHYRTIKINVVTRDDQVLVGHALRYRYYNETDRSFTGCLVMKEKVPNNCMFKLPVGDAAMQHFLYRPASEPNGPPPNKVIADQHICPQHLSTAAFKELCVLPLGFRLQWQNILRQLRAPSVDFIQQSTFTFIAQCVTQAGPAKSDSILRASHSILSDCQFSRELVMSVVDVALGLSESWKSAEAFRAFILIVTRLLQLTSDTSTINLCRKFLQSARKTTLGWAKSLKEKARESQDAETRGEFRQRAAKCALICALAFDLDDDYLSSSLQDPAALSLFLQCSLVVCEGTESGTGGHNLGSLYWQWQRVCYRALPFLTRLITGGSAALDDAIKNSWSGHHLQQGWASVSARNPEWLVRQRSSTSSPTVHFNLLNGELLVNGLPLNRLPSDYESHPTYEILFGKAIIEVMPGDVPGFPFSTNVPFAGHDVQFALTPLSPELRIRATKDDHVLHFVPARLLYGYFPDAFVTDYVHLYDEGTRSLFLRPLDSPWAAASQPWVLKRAGQGHPWQLRKDTSTIISLRTSTSKAIAGILGTLEDEHRIHCISSFDHKRLDIELPGLRIRFYLESGDKAVSCRDFRGMIVDDDQQAGTLIGLSSKLVLKSQTSPSDRRVLVPDGCAKPTKTTDHVVVHISKPFSTYVHVYRIDTLLGGLVEERGLQSKLFRSHLHALTAYCLPDPLTSRTGTEEALRILRSAAVRSFNGLSREAIDLLRTIAAVTPERTYYPSHLRVMQTIHWSSSLGFLAQHDSFVEAAVELLGQAGAHKFFHEDHDHVHPSRLLPAPHRHLLERNKIRVSQCRVAKFGAEDHTASHDSVYPGRDKDSGSDTATTTYAIADSIRRCQAEPHTAVEPRLADHLWAFLQTHCIANEMNKLCISELPYDTQWFRPWDSGTEEYITENFLELHRMLSATDTGCKPLTLATWLASLSCAPEADMSVVHVLATFYTASGEMRRVRLPQSSFQFQLSRGRELQRGQVFSVIEKHLRFFDKYTDIIEGQWQYETLEAYHERGHRSWRERANAAAEQLWDHFRSQWPCSSPSAPTSGPVRTKAQQYFLISSIMPRIQALFGVWYENLQFYKYLEEISAIVSQHKTTIIKPRQGVMTALPIPIPAGRGAVLVGDLFSQPAPSIIALAEVDFAGKFIASEDSTTAAVVASRAHLRGLFCTIRSWADSPFQKHYIDGLEASLDALEKGDFSGKTLLKRPERLSGILEVNLKDCDVLVKKIYQTMVDAVTRQFSDAFQLPRLSPILFLEQLNRHHWNTLSCGWKKLLIEYGLALTRLQRARRLKLARGATLIKELRNNGHVNWTPAEHAEWLLLEIEGAILIRDVQVDIARHMQSPAGGLNSVMQLNMGEGKSSVIVPMLVTSLTDNGKLMRVVVAKPQSKQMLQMLISKLGGLVDRQVFHLPFSRAIKIGTTELTAIQQLFTRCRAEGGVLLVQPEHILSFQLMGIEHKISQRHETADRLLQLHEFMRDHSRDVVDESDENFSPKFELVYSLGLQQPIDHSPVRWTCIQEVLDVIRTCLPQLKEDFPHGIDVHEGPRGCFPRTRLIEPAASEQLLDRLATYVCDRALKGFSITQASRALRNAIYEYIRNPQVSAANIQRVELAPPVGFWSDATKNTLLLLRGLMANGILAFAFGQKRWRVDYGLDIWRNPPTRLAVPYRAKDHPSARSEFSHPDVVIVLTSLSYYYQGLTNEQLRSTLAHLDRSDQAADEYGTWVRDAANLPGSLHQFSGVNLGDQDLCNKKLFPCLKYAKATIDYFLAHIVFTKEMKEFPSRLSASGWDIGEQKTHPTTGFSGTNDAQIVLPLSVKQTMLPAQAHTNALVLQYLAQPETAVEIIPSLDPSFPDETAPSSSLPTTSSDQLLKMVIAMDPPVRVILDVGAQIIELDNLEVAQRWLEHLEDDSGTEGAVFVDQNDDICVVDRKGRIEPLQSSPFLNQLNLCVVFLDDAHTRGIDLKFPENYRAAVTLGANLVKDRLMQACMRMRELGKGQSVVFCVPIEILRKINRLMDHADEERGIQPVDVLAWAISDTWQDARRLTALWAMQGERHEHHSQKWDQARGNGSFGFSEQLAREQLEDEAQPLESRYRPRVSAASVTGPAGMSETQRLIRRRCLELDVDGDSSAVLQEEQERELAPEVEEERQLQRPEPAQPLKHSIHHDVISFIRTGDLPSESTAFVPVFQSLQDSSAARYLAKLRHRASLLYCTRDFQATIVPPSGTKYSSDSYQRPVQWVLTSTGCASKRLSGKAAFKHMLIISPHEAQELMATIMTSTSVALHLYAPLLDRSLHSLDRLDLYTVPAQPAGLAVPPQVILELDLFAGQLYFKTFGEFQALCEYIRVQPPPAPTGAIGSSETGIEEGSSGEGRSNLVGLLNIIMMKIRRDCETIDKTHTGKALDGRLLGEDDFDE